MIQMQAHSKKKLLTLLLFIFFESEIQWVFHKKTPALLHMKFD